MNKTELRKRCQGIIERHNDLEFIQGEDREFLLQLLKDHPFYNYIKGPGVDQLFVKTKRPYNVRGFWIRRENGSAVDFAYNECIAGKVTDEMILKMVMKVAVGQELEEVKNKVFSGPEERICTNCFVPIWKDTAHLAHIKKYREIARLFLIEKKIKNFSSWFSEDPGHGIGYQFRTYSQWNEWMKFYKQRAMYKFLCVDCNFKLF